MSDGKRKVDSGAKLPETTKKARNTKGQPSVQLDDWPEYFVSLFKTYKALNTVLAFCSSRGSVATTFAVIRTSVENITKKPLELKSVAEIKALLPNLVKFAYIPADDHRIHEKRRGDLYATGQSDIDEHVLVMEFHGTPTSGYKKNAGDHFTPATLGPQAVKKLIERRNARFVAAINELIDASNPAGEDPVQMLQKAGKDHIPVNPSSHTASTSNVLTASTGPALVPNAESRASIESIIAEIEAQELYRSQILYKRVFDARPARWGTLDCALPEPITQALRDARNVTGFYRHQAHAINAFWKGRNVIVSTATASGKSIIYQVPTLCACFDDPEATAMFIYPTKALAQDQKTAFMQLLARCPPLARVNLATYDGDTPKEERPGIRETATIIFTNFDTIHASILPNEDRWRRFMKNLKCVVVDELHYYSGLMGSHVALIMRRFRRVCAAVGNRKLRFVSCSATISSPAKHMSNIFGVDIDNIEVVTDDGSPAGRKDFLLWRPPLCDEMASGFGRTASAFEACALFVFLMKRGIRTIVFCKIRRTCEMFMKVVRASLLAEGRSDIASKVRAYRGGYSPEDRRVIEKEAFGGDLLGIIATNALELGVDIGSLDAVISLGFPHSLASFRQQSGRAGRRSRDSLSVFVSDSLPIDRHFVANPDDIFDKPTEALLVDVENRVILESHVQCAAHEMPIHVEEDQQYFGPLLKDICANLTRDQEGWYHTHTKYLPHPASHIAVRGAREEKYTIVDITNIDQPQGRSKVLEEIEVSRALFEAYEGAVFMHQGLPHIVKEVSHDERTARIIRSDVNWITRPRDFTDVDPTQTYRIREIRGSPKRAYFGRVDICTHIVGFTRLRDNKVFDIVDLDTPPYERDSTGMWVDVPRQVIEILSYKGWNPAAGIHSAQHAVLSLMPLYSTASRSDISTDCKSAATESLATELKRKRPARLVFYDAAGAGGGICAKAFDNMTDLLHQALYVVEKCDCKDDNGCLSCIKSTLCKGGSVASKLGAIAVLRGVLGLPVSPEDIPYAKEPDLMDTIVVALAVRTLGDVEVEPDNIDKN